jgi:hypothetical protein
MDILKPQTPESEKQLENGINAELADYFETDPLEINVVVYKSKADLDKSWHEYWGDDYSKQAPEWLTAFATNGIDIHILSPDVIPAGDEKDGYTRFHKTLKHELSHLYIHQIDARLPSWLEEGVCLHIAKQGGYKKIDPDEISTGLLHELDYAPTDERIYSIGKNMVDQIIENFGKEKLFEIMSITDNDERYAELRRMFGWLK